MTPRPTPVDEAWIPADTCTLPTTQRPLRVAEFDDLFRAAVREVDHASPTRAQLTLVGGLGLVARVEDLTDRETACCSFFTFTITSSASADPHEVRVILDIQVPHDRADVLAALVDRVRVSPGGQA